MEAQLTSLGFSADYKVRRFAGEPAAGTALQFLRRPDAQVGINFQSAKSGLALEVEPNCGRPWIGEYQGGPEGIDGVFATPSTDTVCVIVKGQGYWVPVLDPQHYQVVRSTPIKRVIPIVDRRILVFVDFSRIVAYGAAGFLWLTPDLSWDGLEITDIGTDVILGTGWDSPAGRQVPFSVDLRTGESEGGSSPAKYGVPDSRK